MIGRNDIERILKWLYTKRLKKEYKFEGVEDLFSNGVATLAWLLEREKKGRRNNSEVRKMKTIIENKLEEMNAYNHDNIHIISVLYLNYYILMLIDDEISEKTLYDNIDRIIRLRYEYEKREVVNEVMKRC